ncbi:MAG TPA: DUF1289 domain-containing protein [Caldimonas sp.]|nr:DUF1289 domain-containing protein [Caldimonas sp.]HEX4233084.1 DUF1289 domain-containing protein [Caldimonas sp.]
MAGSAIPSPCSSVCTIDPATGWCAGCLRTINEIAAWGSLDDRAKRAVWKMLPERRAERDRRAAADGIAAPAASAATP